MSRKAIPKKIRFEVFKRDSFTCQYCGKKAPDVVLHVDHIEPVSKAGGDEIINLITSCQDCNLGKSDRRLSDQSTLALQRQQLDDLNQRREQLQLMMQWRKGLKSIEEEATNLAVSEWNKILEGHWVLNETGIQGMRDYVRRFGLALVLEAIEIARHQYLKRGADGKLIAESAGTAIRKVGGICHHKSQPQDEQALFYCRGILRNRLSYLNERQAMALLREAMGAGATSSDLKQIAKEAKHWTGWQQDMEALIQEMNQDNG